MSRQRWGTFSVTDHLHTRAFFSEVFLYDRLVIPYPPNDDERKRWRASKWAPGLLEDCLETLGNLAVPAPWTESRKQEFNSRYTLAQEASFDTKVLADAQEQGAKDPMYITRQILTELKEFPPDVWPVAAYPSREQFAEEFELKDSQLTEGVKPEDGQGRAERLGWLLGHRFLAPANEMRNDLYLLQEAIKLASTDEFQAYRAKLYEWQDGIIRDNTSDEDALEEMQKLLEKYNTVAQARHRERQEKFIYTVVAPSALSVAPLVLPALPAALLVSAGIFLSFHNFTKFEREPAVLTGKYEAAAMFHDIYKHFGWH